MLIGPHSTTNEIEEFANKIKNNPRNFIAQPTLELSTVHRYVRENYIQVMLI